MMIALYTDAETNRLASELPRKCSASKIMRYVLKAAMTSDADFEVYKRENKDAKEVRLYLREKLLPRLLND